ERVAERLELVVDVAGLDLGLAHRQLLGLEPEHRPDRHAGRGADPGEHHGSPPNLPSTSSWIADSASPSSAPIAFTRIVEPSSAASIITPMMLLPFTSSPSRDTMTSALKRDAVFTNSAQARACRPSWLRIRSWISATDPPRSGQVNCGSARPGSVRGGRTRAPSASGTAGPAARSAGRRPTPRRARTVPRLAGARLRAPAPTR